MALGLSKMVIEGGDKVVYLDKENGPRTITERLLSLKTDKSQVQSSLRYYFAPSTSLSAESQGAYEDLLDTEKPALIVFDSWIGFLTDANINENQSSEIQIWSNYYLHPAREREITTLILDHMPLDVNRARGSARKKEEVDVQWGLHNSEGFDRRTVGKLRLKIEKDREGWLPRSRDFEVGGSDGVFIFHPVTEPDRNSDLTPRASLVYKVLENKFDKGATDSDWKAACKEYEGISNSTYYNVKKTLLEKGYVEEREGKFRIIRDAF